MPARNFAFFRLESSHPTLVHRLSAYLLIAAGLAGLLFYAIYLNKIYYQRYGPFYDSMAYMNQLAAVMEVSRRDGIFAAVISGIKSANTVFFPWLEAAVLGQFASPTRSLSVLVQFPFVIVQVVTGYLFFSRVPKYSPLVSAVYSLSLASFLSIFFYNGGLSDLRMDLLQALSVGSTLALVGLGRHTQQRIYWIWAGFVWGVACLSRATTPVYGLIIFTILLVYDLIYASRLGNKSVRLVTKNYLIFAVISCAISLWFYLLKFNGLYYYYFVWNFDATARIPLSISREHAVFVKSQHIGEYLAAFAAALFIWECAVHLRRGEFYGFNFTMMVGAFASVGFLVFSGAALNPFVSMVGAPLALLFLLAPFSERSRGQRMIIGNWLRCSCIITAIGLTALTGKSTHTTQVSPYAPLRGGITAVISSVLEDARDRGKDKIVIGTTYAGSLQTFVITNSLVFDHNFRMGASYEASDLALQVQEIYYGLSNPVEWAGISGVKDDDKINTIAADLIKRADYVVVPAAGTILAPHHAVSSHAFKLSGKLTSAGCFVQIAGPITITPTESVSVLRNCAR